MGDLAQQSRLKAPAWAWNGTSIGTSDNTSFVGSPIADLVARLAAIRVAQAPVQSPSAAKEAAANRERVQSDVTADVSVVIEDNKENLMWRQEGRSFEERLKGAAKDRAHVTSAAQAVMSAKAGVTRSRAEMTSATVQAVNGLQQGLQNLSSSTSRRVSVEGQAGYTNQVLDGYANQVLDGRVKATESRLSRERLATTDAKTSHANQSKAGYADPVKAGYANQSGGLATEASGQWTRMWTQLSDESQRADVTGASGDCMQGQGASSGALENGAGGEAAVSHGAGRAPNLSVLDTSLANIPGQVDTTSYLLGERAALERAFQQVIPQRDQVTTLHGAVAQLQSLSQQESGRLRRLENAGNVFQVSMSTATDRLQRVEQSIPALEMSLAELRGHLEGMSYVTAELSAVRASLAVLEANQEHIRERLSYSSSSFFRLLTGSWGRLLGYLARADVAALYLARKVLLDSAEVVGPTETANETHCSSAGPTPVSDFDWSTNHVHALARAVTRHRKVRSAAGAILVVAAVEATWRLQRAARRPLPGVLRSMTVPLDTCLRVARICVWASAFVVGAEELKKGCYSAADSVTKLHDSLTVRIKTRGTVLADRVAVQGQGLRSQWSRLSGALAQYTGRMGSERPVTGVEVEEDLERGLVLEVGSRAVARVTEYSESSAGSSKFSLCATTSNK